MYADFISAESHVLNITQQSTLGLCSFLKDHPERWKVLKPNFSSLSSELSNLIRWNAKFFPHFFPQVVLLFGVTFFGNN